MCLCVCVCACACGGEKERGRKESMGEQDVVTETEGGTCRRHQLKQKQGPPDTLMLGMDSQTIVCLIMYFHFFINFVIHLFIYLFYYFLRVSHRGVSLLNTIEHRFSILLVSHVVQW